MLVWLPVPPSKRQAAGPLNENLPNVVAGGPEESRGRLSSRTACAKHRTTFPQKQARVLHRVCAVFKARHVASAQRCGTGITCSTGTDQTVERMVLFKAQPHYEWAVRNGSGSEWTEVQLGDRRGDLA